MLVLFSAAVRQEVGDDEIAQTFRDWRDVLSDARLIQTNSGASVATAVFAADRRHAWHLRIDTVTAEDQVTIAAINLVEAPHLHPDLVVDDFDDLIRILQTSAPLVTFHLEDLRSGRVLASHDSDTPMPIASTSKLLLLLAFLEQYGPPDEWPAVLALSEGARSPWHGLVLSTASELSTAEVLTALIAASDNTAADMVMDAVGRAAVEAAYTSVGGSVDQLPFLRTREMTAVKRRFALLEEWQELEYAGRLAAAERAARDPLELLAKVGWEEPRKVLECGWFLPATSVAEVWRLIGRAIQDDDTGLLEQIITTNPGALRDPGDDWSLVGYNGGSEPGVLYTSWYLKREDGRDFALAIGACDPEHQLNRQSRLDVWLPQQTLPLIPQ